MTVGLCRVTVDMLGWVLQAAFVLSLDTENIDYDAVSILFQNLSLISILVQYGHIAHLILHTNIHT